jgi:hypothetical protein
LSFSFPFLLCRTCFSHSGDYVFWDITPCSLLKVDRRFGGIYRLHLQCRRVSQARDQCEAGSRQSSGDMFFRNVGWFSTN